MKALRHLLAIGLLAALALPATGCFGNAREVDSCDDCIESATLRHTEYCVSGVDNALYCANPCTGEINCDAYHTCVPLVDEGTWYEPEREGDTRWVCMPVDYYESYGVVYRVWDECSTGMGHECPTGLECLYDDESEAYTIWFCSDPCDYDSDCLTGCCAMVGSDDFCAPWRYCH